MDLCDYRSLLRQGAAVHSWCISCWAFGEATASPGAGTVLKREKYWKQIGIQRFSC